MGTDSRFEPPPAEGVRLQWSQLPARVRGAVEGWLGSRVVSATTRPTGFSPGLAAQLQAANGRLVFAKAVCSEPNPDTPILHRREAKVVRALPEGAPVPRLLWTYDEGEPGWIVLIFQYVSGWNPTLPWHVEELGRVIEALGTLAEVLTPSPLRGDAVATAGDLMARRICSWKLLQQERPDDLDDWSLRHLDKLVALDAVATQAVAGETLLHFDIRADNVLLTPDRVWFVDWPHACVGAAWVDLVGFAPSVTMQGGPTPELLLKRHPAYRDTDPGAVTAVVAAVAGYFTHRALQPPPAGLPTVRAFQAAQGIVARRWVMERTGWS